MILVVEDELDLRHLVTEALIEAGYHVRSVADGVEALDAIAQEEPDLVLTDVTMPRLDGCSLAGRLIQAGSRFPVVLMSGALRESPLATVRLVRKPFDIDELLATVAGELALASRSAARRGSRAAAPAPRASC